MPLNVTWAVLAFMARHDSDVMFKRVPASHAGPLREGVTAADFVTVRTGHASTRVIDEAKRTQREPHTGPAFVRQG